MEVVIAPDAEAASLWCADFVTAAVLSNPRLNLGVATGSSPEGLYAQMALRSSRGIDFSGVSLFSLDEYVGLPANDKNAYNQVVRTAIGVPLGIPDSSIHTPDVHVTDLEATCATYEEAIRSSGGIDIQILGIGQNGHLAFNEPGSGLFSRTRAARLTAETRNANARFFGGLSLVPTQCVTQGLGTILESRRLLLVASGFEKSVAIQQAIEGPISASCPASILQLHPDATIVLDGPASSRLTKVMAYSQS